jgi:protein translocase SecG subunit
LHTVTLIIQIVTALALVVLMAIQTDKAEQGGGGVMGLGAAGGRSSGNINLPVGAERILKPLTTWIAIGFLCSSLLNAIPGGPTVAAFLFVLVFYILAMTIGAKLWKALSGIFG